MHYKFNLSDRHIMDPKEINNKWQNNLVVLEFNLISNPVFINSCISIGKINVIVNFFNIIEGFYQTLGSLTRLYCLKKATSSPSSSVI